MQVLAILLAFAAAACTFRARLVGTPLVPGYIEKIRILHNVVEPAFWAQAKLARYLFEDVKQHGGVSGSPDDPSVELRNSLATVAETLEKAHQALQTSDLLESDAAITAIANGRVWHLAAAALALGSGVLQTLNFLSS